jgi:hypothetical protein
VRPTIAGAVQLQGADGFGNQRNAQSGGDEREQHRGVRGLVLAPGTEACGATTRHHGFVDHRMCVGVHDEVLVREIGDVERRFGGEPVIDGQREHQGFRGDLP